MLTVITGPRNSGKSLAGERLALLSPDRPLYVATLPPHIDNSGRIDAHKKRRDGRWSVYETNRPWDETQVALGRLFEEHRSILLDGMSSMLWVQLKMFGATRATLQQVCEETLALLRQFSDRRDIILVDCSQPLPSHSAQFWFNALMTDFHSRLRLYSRQDQDREGGAPRA
jgi:adenosyl cobinamide kinase/adenosyl cobinamide phosphate guanylyltransferase